MSVEKAYMTGAKLLGIVFELVLLFSSMFPESDNVSLGVVHAVLLSFFSMSFSAEASLFDDGLLLRYSNENRWMRAVLYAAILASFASMTICFSALTIAHSHHWESDRWGLLCIILCILALPRLFAYLGDFAYTVHGTGKEAGPVITNHMPEATARFEGR